jgi:transcriptional antiterminator RfaH
MNEHPPPQRADELASPAHAVPAWFAAQAKPNAAHIAARNLARQGFAVFLPLERYTSRRGRSLVPALRPYFAGYLFVGFDPEAAPWRAVRSTYGVSRLISFGASPAPVDPELVAGLMRACDGGGVMHPRLDLKRGERVMIAEGPLAGLIGRLDAMAPRERAWLLLEVMGKATRVSVSASGLRRAG